MPLFVIFIFSAVILGTGALLAPAWKTAQPRIGLAAAAALALVIGGAVVYAMLFGWNTLVVDYMLFVLVTVIFLGGTLTFGQRRAEARGIDLGDFHEGWTSPRDLLFFSFVALVFILPTLILPVPMDTDAQGFGYMALTAKLGGGFTSLAPFHPDATYLYAPGFIALSAYLSQQLGQGLHITQFATAAVLSVLLVWLAYDFGSEVQDKRLGRAMALAMFGGVGLYTAYMDSHYTTLLALVFALAFLTYAWRYGRDGLPLDAVAAGLMLGAVVLSHPDTTIILALGWCPYLLLMWLGKPRPTRSRWLVLAFGVPLIALVAVSPWLWGVRDLLGADIASPFERDPSYWRVMIVYHGVWIVPVALIGLATQLRRRHPLALLGGGWLLLVLDFSTTGVIPSLLAAVAPALLKYDYPFSIAWHGPILPYTILGGYGLLWLYERFVERRFGAALHRAAPALLIALSAAALAAGAANEQLLALSRGIVRFHGAFSSHDDVAAMTWIRANTPPDARILNYPGPHEADWAPVITERDTVYFRPQPFFRGASLPTVDTPSDEGRRLLAFWRNPEDTANADLLREAGIDYVLVPQVINSPNTLADMWRWNTPFVPEPGFTMQSDVRDGARYLTPVFERNGAAVYAVDAAQP